jgi:hypothetical protein
MSEIPGTVQESFTEKVVTRSRSECAPPARADRIRINDLTASSAVDVSGEPANGRRGTPPVGFVDDRQRLQATAARLRVDLPNIDKLLRLGAVALVERCEAVCAQRGDVGAGYLAQLILQGGPSVQAPKPRGVIVAPAAKPCPLQPSERASLGERWAEIEARIRVGLGHATALTWDTWMIGAHLHRVGDDLELGVGPVASAWVKRRYGRLVDEIAGCPVAYVPCEAAA